MPSSLSKLMFWKEMTWTNFGPPDPSKKPPSDGHRGSAAFTFVKWEWSRSPKAEKVPGEKKKYRLKDNVGVKISFSKGKSWVAKWVFDTQTQAFQDNLLRHEIGHYKICALVARDMFIELMQLKGNVYDSQSALGADINKIIKRYHNDKIELLHDLYDEPTEADHGLDAAGQDRWDGYFDTAFTKIRSPRTEAADGTAHKVTFYDTLKADGKLPEELKTS